MSWVHESGSRRRHKVASVATHAIGFAEPSLNVQSAGIGNRETVQGRQARGPDYGCAASVTVAVADWPRLVYSMDTVSPGFLVKVSSSS